MVYQIGFVLGDQINQQTISMAFDGFLKLIFIVAFGLYLIFSLIATRQIHVMKNTLLTPFSPLIQILGYSHLALAIISFIFILML